MLSGLIDWIDERFPLTALMKEHATEYYAPKNFNFWYVLRRRSPWWCW